MPLAEAAKLMMERRYRHLPVVQDGKLVGLLTHRDLMGRRRSTLSSVRAFDSRQKVGDIMKTELLTVDSDESLSSCFARMSEARVGCLPVTRGDKLIGILTETDALAALAEIAAQPARLSWRDLPVSYYTCPGCYTLPPTETVELAAEKFAAGAKLVAIWDERLLGVFSPSDLLANPSDALLRDAMTRSAISIHVGSSVAEAARILLERDVHQCLVRRGTRCVGIFSRSSCFSVLRDLRLSEKVADSASRTLYTVGATEPVANARKFLEHVETRAVLVQEGRHVVGLLGAEEIATAQAEDSAKRAGQVASPAFFAVPESAPVWLVAAQAEALGARAVIVESAGEARGIFTATDAARRVATLV